MHEGYGLYSSIIFFSDNSVLHLYFYYLMNLNILTVKSKISTSVDLSGAISSGSVDEHDIHIKTILNYFV